MIETEKKLDPTHVKHLMLCVLNSNEGPMSADDIATLIRRLHPEAPFDSWHDMPVKALQAEGMINPDYAPLRITYAGREQAREWETNADIKKLRQEFARGYKDAVQTTLKALHREGPKTYEALRAKAAPASQKFLESVLHDLKHQGLLVRPDSRQKQHQYALTDAGQEMAKRLQKEPRSLYFIQPDGAFTEHAYELKPNLLAQVPDPLPRVFVTEVETVQGEPTPVITSGPHGTDVTWHETIAYRDALAENPLLEPPGRK